MKRKPALYNESYESRDLDNVEEAKRKEQEKRGKLLAEEGLDYMIEKAIKKGIGTN